MGHQIKEYLKIGHDLAFDFGEHLDMAGDARSTSASYV